MEYVNKNQRDWMFRGQRTGVSCIDNFLQENKDITAFNLSKDLTGKALELYNKQMPGTCVKVYTEGKTKLCNSMILFKISSNIEQIRKELAADLQLLADNNIWHYGMLYCVINNVVDGGTVPRYLGCAQIGINPDIESDVLSPGTDEVTNSGKLTRYGIIKKKCPSMRCVMYDL